MASPAHPIVLPDMTTPANLRMKAAPAADRRPAEPDHLGRAAGHDGGAGPVSSASRVGSTGGVGRAANLTLLAGIWLVISGISLNYHETGMFDAYWSDVVVGTALAVIALVCLVTPAITGSLTLTRVALGGWLVAAPFVLGYSDVSKPRWNDIAVGIVVMSLAIVGTGGPARIDR
jgi:hypothetical protein